MLTWEWYHDPVCFSVFIHVLLTANHEARKWQGQSISAGQTVVSLGKMAHTLGFGVQRIRTAIDKLKSTGEITSSGTNKYTLITVVNWGKYQCDNMQANEQLTINQQTTNKQLTTPKEVKKERKKGPTTKVTLGEWESTHGELTLEAVPKFKETYGGDAARHLAKFRNSCEAGGRLYVNFAKALQAWEWPAPPKKEAASWMKSQG